MVQRRNPPRDRADVGATVTAVAYELGLPLAERRASIEKTTRREQIIIGLLRTLGDVVSTMRAGSGYSRRESVRLYFSFEYEEGSYRQLESVLVRMRSEVPWLYGPVRDRYLNCQRVQKLVRRSSAGVWYDVRFGRPFAQQQQKFLKAETPGKEKESIGEQERMVEYWSQKIHEEQVRDGIAWLAQHFPGEPQLPKAFALVAA
jgi:hypothetical protein